MEEEGSKVPGRHNYYVKYQFQHIHECKVAKCPISTAIFTATQTGQNLPGGGGGEINNRYVTVTIFSMNRTI